MVAPFQKELEQKAVADKNYTVFAKTDSEGINSYIAAFLRQHTTEVSIPKQSQWRFRGLKKGFVTPEKGRKVLLMNKEERDMLMEWHYKVDKERGFDGKIASIAKNMIEPVSVLNGVVKMRGVHHHCLRNKVLSFEETEMGVLITPKRVPRRQS